MRKYAFGVGNSQAKNDVCKKRRPNSALEKRCAARWNARRPLRERSYACVGTWPPKAQGYLRFAPSGPKGAISQPPQVNDLIGREIRILDGQPGIPSGHLPLKHLLRQPDPAQQVGEPRVGAQRVPESLNLNVGETIEALLAGFFEPRERLIPVF